MKEKKILLVDDDAVNLKILMNILDNNEYSIIQASGGLEAVEMAKNFHPDLIILDIVMPDIDGGEVANILKNNPSTKNIPIIFLSSLIKEEEEKYSSRRDGIYLMSKPCNRDQLIRIARQQLFIGGQKARQKCKKDVSYL
jgi:CheY-like chemotaxis protein